VNPVVRISVIKLRFLRVAPSLLPLFLKSNQHLLLKTCSIRTPQSFPTLKYPQFLCKYRTAPLHHTTLPQPPSTPPRILPLLTSTLSPPSTLPTCLHNKLTPPPSHRPAQSPPPVTQRHPTLPRTTLPPTSLTPHTPSLELRAPGCTLPTSVKLLQTRLLGNQSLSAQLGVWWGGLTS
jgi:hypothetical protein